ncbi:helix-turn-helix domain-containing protein [Actinomadura rifamycini]|uniref:helix-turn-helix domain-containing protein n=1 Tax=Actinomadura rifamycini TaxID=31962 RepID=UPI00040168B3|nr:helix-turn-helix domain-containing protein [Actinomadura rifamycini]
MTPEERQAFGRRLAAERAARGLTQRALAVRVCAALPDAQRPDLATVEGYVKRWEAGRAGIGERNRLALAEALGIEDADLFGGRSGPPRRETDEERRRLLACLGLLGVDAGVADEPLEPIRQALADAIPGGPRDRLIADWEEVAFEYGHAFLTAPPGALLPDLAHDLVRLQRIVRAVDDAGARRGLCAPAGKLAALVAMTVATLGHARQARDWWKTARHTADASADRNLRVWVRGYESMSALYAGRPLAPVLRLADEAIAIAGSSSGAAVLEAMAARAQALALLGRTGDAAGAVRAMEDRFERLPQAPADERLSTGAWPETALRHTAAFTYTCVRDAARAERAQADALRLYPEGMKRQRAQIELLRATCLVQAGDVAAGVAHASRAVGSLSRSQRTATVARGARMVLDAVPEERREQSCVREPRELASPGPRGRVAG